MKTKLIHITPDAEKIMAYCARVSSKDQENPKIEGLLKYCIKHKHWSVFQMASLCVEIVTSRAIAQQILRHRSFSFQEFSMRYAESQHFEMYEARRQDTSNRQNSIDDMSEEDQDWFDTAQSRVIILSNELYNQALKRNIAKEQARFLLPLLTETKLYMHGTVRDFLHYVNLRVENGTQKEHADIANEIKKIMIKELPITSAALDWKGSE